MSRYPAQDMEPAVRDPKKLGRTAWSLVALMVVGAGVILLAYNRDAKRQAEDDRPAIVNRLNGNFRLWRQDESEGAILDLEGKVIVIAPVVFGQQESWDATREVLQALAAKYRDSDLRIVMLTLDPEKEPPTVLADYAKELDAQLPFWWLAGAQEESVHKFVKVRLKAQIYPHRVDGQWKYDPSLVVIDRDRHIRKATIRARKPDGTLLNERRTLEFNFEEAADLDAEGVAAGYEWDQEGNAEPIEETNVNVLRDHLFETVARLLEEPGKKQG